MPFDHYDAVKTTVGRTIRIVLDDLPRDRLPPGPDGTRELGEFPAVFIEQLGNDNKDWIAYQIMRANPKRAKELEAKAKARIAPTVESKQADIKETEDFHREGIRCAVRKLELRQSDGTPATDADIKEWLAQLPQRTVTRIWNEAWDETNFYNGAPQPSPKEIAGES